MQARALLTGGTGFVGRALAGRLVQEGWEVDAIVRPRSRLEAVEALSRHCRVHTHDGTTLDLVRIVREAEPDVVFHLASVVLIEHRPEDVDELIRSNVLFSTQLVEAMVLSGSRRLVNVGTSWQHYQTRAYRPVNLYAATKQAFQDVLAYYHDADGVSVITLKLFDTYGPADTRGKILAALVEAATSGEGLDLSPADQIVDLTHVDDVACALYLAALRLIGSPEPLQEQFFVTGERYQVRQLVELVERETGRHVDVRLGGREYREREVMAPVAHVQPLPGWTPTITVAGFLRGDQSSRAMADGICRASGR